MDSSVFFGLSTIAYILAMVSYIVYLAFRKTQMGIIATTITIAGFIAQTLAIALRWSEFYEIGAGTSEIRRMLIGRELYKEIA